MSFFPYCAESQVLSAVVVLLDELQHQSLVAGGLLADIGVVVGAQHGDAAVDHAR